MQKEIKEKSIAASLFVLALPTVIEQILNTLFQYVDTAMVGKLGENATAAVSVTTTINWLISSIPSAIGIAALTMVAKAVGSKDEDKIKRISGQIVSLVLLSGILISVLACGLSPFIPRWMKAEENIWRDGTIYFLIISLPMVFRFSSHILGSVIRGAGDTKTPMIITIFANLFNIGLNYLFIYALQMGVTGAAIASAISFSLSGIAMFIVFCNNKVLNKDGLKLCFDTKILKEIAEIGVPVLGTNITSCAGYVVFAALVSGMGTTVFAAHSLAVTAETLFYIPGYGFRSATSTLVGNAVGEKNERKLKEVEKYSILFTVGMMFFTGAVLYFTAFPLMKVFTPSEEVARLGAQMLKIVAFTEPFFGLMIVMEGIFYGKGKTTYPFIIETISMWAVRILFTYLCVVVWNLSLREVWFCMIADNIFKAIALGIPLVINRIKRK